MRNLKYYYNRIIHMLKVKYDRFRIKNESLGLYIFYKPVIYYTYNFIPGYIFIYFYITFMILHNLLKFHNNFFFFVNYYSIICIDLHH